MFGVWVLGATIKQKSQKRQNEKRDKEKREGMVICCLLVVYHFAIIIKTILLCIVYCICLRGENHKEIGPSTISTISTIREIFILCSLQKDIRILKYSSTTTMVTQKHLTMCVCLSVYEVCSDTHSFFVLWEFVFQSPFVLSRAHISHRERLCRAVQPILHIRDDTVSLCAW